MSSYTGLTLTQGVVAFTVNSLDVTNLGDVDAGVYQVSAFFTVANTALNIEVKFIVNIVCGPI